MPLSENKQKMLRGELYHAFTLELVAERNRCTALVNEYNNINGGKTPRRKLVELWREIVNNNTPLPPQASTPEEDELLFQNDPWVASPVHIDYGYNTRLGMNVFINFNCTILDTCLVSIGSRTLVGPNVSFYSGTHPLDPVLRNGTQGPESGKDIDVGDDCWIGGNVVILPGVRLGKGVVVGAGSVVTKDVPDYHVVAGNPARILRKIEPSVPPGSEEQKDGAENSMSDLAEELEVTPGGQL